MQNFMYSNGAFWWKKLAFTSGQVPISTGHLRTNWGQFFDTQKIDFVLGFRFFVRQLLCEEKLLSKKVVALIQLCHRMDRAVACANDIRPWLSNWIGNLEKRDCERWLAAMRIKFTWKLKQWIYSEVETSQRIVTICGEKKLFRSSDVSLVECAHHAKLYDLH